LLTPEETEVVLLALQVAVWVVAVSLVPGIVLAWILARWRSPLRALLQGVVMLPLVLPPVVTGYLLLRILGRSSPLGRLWHEVTGGHIAYTTGACVIAAAVVGFPLLVESIRLSILGVDPRLELVSRSLGRGRLGTFLRVTLPLSLPGVLAGSVLSFARALGEFGATIILAGNIEGETRQIPLAVYTLLNIPGAESRVMWLTAVSVALALVALLTAAWLSRIQRLRSGAR
jgi:molybdate transport system permease protein